MIDEIGDESSKTPIVTAVLHTKEERQAM